jgi:hypothetical protein
MLQTDAGDLRITECPPVLNLDAARARDALQFHREIENSAKTRDNGPSYALLPIVGTGQPTFQSASTSGLQDQSCYEKSSTFWGLKGHSEECSLEV